MKSAVTRADIAILRKQTSDVWEFARYLLADDVDGLEDADLKALEEAASTLERASAGLARMAERWAAERRNHDSCHDARRSRQDSPSRAAVSRVVAPFQR